MSLDTRGVQIANGSKNPDDEQSQDYVADTVSFFTLPSKLLFM